MTRLPSLWLVVVLLSGAQVPGQSAFTCIEPDGATGSSGAVIVNDVPLAHTTQVLPLDKSGRIAGREDITKQTSQVLANLSLILKAAGSDLSQVVKLNVYLARGESIPAVQLALSHSFKPLTYPAVSIVVSDLPETGALVAMDAVGVIANRPSGPRDALVYESKGIESVAILPAGPKIYVSGMADTNRLQAATQKTLEKLLAALDHLGLNKTDIVQLKAFIQPMSEVGTVRQEITNFFTGKAPPTVFVEWISPSPNPPIEIELIARGRKDQSQERNALSFLTPPGTTSTKVFSRVVRVDRGKQVYVSAVYGNPRGGSAEVREIFGSLGSVLRKAGSDFDHLAKATYYVTDEEASNQLNLIRPEFYPPQRPPAASKAKVRGVGREGGTVTLDMIAVVP